MGKNPKKHITAAIIVDYMTGGITRQQIAAKLGITKSTVDYHLRKAGIRGLEGRLLGHTGGLTEILEGTEDHTPAASPNWMDDVSAEREENARMAQVAEHLVEGHQLGVVTSEALVRRVRDAFPSIAVNGAPMPNTPAEMDHRARLITYYVRSWKLGLLRGEDLMLELHGVIDPSRVTRCA